MTRRLIPILILSVSVVACGGEPQTTSPAPEATAPSHGALDRGLLVAMAVLGRTPDGKPQTLPARLGLLTRGDDGWAYREIEDPDSNVFHKAMVYRPRPDGPGGILTAGGTGAFLKWWVPGAEPEVLWSEDFGGKTSRMRDIETGDLAGDGVEEIAVATHDQGIVAVVDPTDDGGWNVTKLDHRPGIFVHEIELGDLDDDGTLEIYATPSTPNKLDGSPQPGWVTRYVPATGEGPTDVVDLGTDHAKEILVDDVDGDGTDELYVSVEAVSGGRVRILRVEADTDPAAAPVIATLDDTLTRFLTAGDFDGDGVREMVAAGKSSGLWLLRPGADPNGPWVMTSIDRDSGGFEHAALLTDLDGDGIDELYVADDDDHEINRYVWADGTFVRETLYTHPDGLSGFTWNLMPAPVALMP